MRNGHLAWVAGLAGSSERLPPQEPGMQRRGGLAPARSRSAAVLAAVVWAARCAWRGSATASAGAARRARGATCRRSATRAGSRLPGLLETGQPWVIDFRIVPHWLNAGATQSGKSNLANAIIKGRSRSSSWWTRSPSCS